MKCCECDKKLDVSKNEIPATWFGKYTVSGLVEVICKTCIQDIEKQKRWMQGVVYTD